MKTITPYLLAPTGLWMFWLVTYINHVVGSSYQDWWDPAFFLTLLSAQVLAIAVSVIAIVTLMKRYDDTEESE